ncbi:hypothetical protein KR093_000872 [Drosophila rubida]|uniref:folate gamma-glutamyl hydrolase n=1 Tax=Drosophila rubida TaxID=30044 RepID=A0AAD4PHM0_9MUSC|nr:hypothetical protein KR093_000872 [Drosophila rubida]
MKRSDGMESAHNPHIGVMCMDMAKSLEKHLGVGIWHSYLPVSYVKQLESVGAVVIPIWIGRERAYYEAIMQLVNGVLLPGGAVLLDDKKPPEHPHLTNDCVTAARHIYEIAMAKNAAGEYFPVWGTCLGFQLMMINAAGTKEVRTTCRKPRFEALPLQLSRDYAESQLFAGQPDELAQEMGREPFACHQHRYCITESELRHYKLHEDWHVLATRDDEDNAPRFVTLIEHRKYPIAGAQFHPEKVAYELLFAKPDNCRESHTAECIKLAQHFANFFVSACRRNANRFASAEQQACHMICNWQPVFCGKFIHSHWLECYLFKQHVDYPRECRSLATSEAAPAVATEATAVP